MICKKWSLTNIGTLLWIHDEGELENFGYDISVIWNQIKNKFPEYKLERSFKSHTHGIEPHIHRDDGDVTFIYYPRMDGSPKWDEPSVFDENYNVILQLGIEVIG